MSLLECVLLATASKGDERASLLHAAVVAIAFCVRCLHARLGCMRSTCFACCDPCDVCHTVASTPQLCSPLYAAAAGSGTVPAPGQELRQPSQPHVRRRSCHDMRTAGPLCEPRALEQVQGPAHWKIKPPFPATQRLQHATAGSQPCHWANVPEWP